MTWHTPGGDRVLNPAEAKLFATAVANLVEQYQENPRDGLNYGYPLTHGPFERLTTPQKLTILEEVVEALLTETPAPPPLVAVTEQAIYYVFCWICQQFDIVEDGEEFWGQMVLDALGRSGSASAQEVAEGKEAPFIGCGDPEEWECAIEEVADRILWDRDWEMEEDKLSPTVMALARIEEGYFSRRQVSARRGAAQRLLALCSRFSD
jgi:hypothetical protein